MSHAYVNVNDLFSGPWYSAKIYTNTKSDGSVVIDRAVWRRAPTKEDLKLIAWLSDPVGQAPTIPNFCEQEVNLNANQEETPIMTTRTITVGNQPRISKAPNPEVYFQASSLVKVGVPVENAIQRALVNIYSTISMDDVQKYIDQFKRLFGDTSTYTKSIYEESKKIRKAKLKVWAKKIQVDLILMAAVCAKEL